VCAHEVCMTMSYLRRFVTLSLNCDGCQNKANLRRALPLEAAPAIRRTYEDESQWG